MLPSLLTDNKRLLLLLSLILVGVAQSLAIVSLIWAAKQTIADEQEALTSLIVIAGFLGISALSLCRFVERYFAEVMAQSYVEELRKHVFNHASELSPRARERFHRSSVLLRLTGDMSAIRNWYVQGVAPLVVLGIWLAVSVAALWWLNSLLFTVVAMFIAIAVFGNYILGKQLYKESLHTRRYRGYLMRNVTELMGQLRLVQLFNQHQREQKRFSRQSSRLVNAQIKRARISGLLRGFNEFVLGATVLALLMVGAYLVQQQLLSSENLAVTMAASLYLLAHMRRLSRLYEYWTLKNVAVDKVDQFLAKEGIQTTSEQQKRKQRKNNKRTTESLTIQLIGFRSQGRFPSIDAEVTSGCRIAVSGEQGVGKSSLLLGLLGEIETKGRFNIGGRPVKKLSQRERSQIMTLVSPELPLLRGSVKKNLFYGARHVDDKYTQQILALCGVTEWLDSQPEGLNFRLTEAGENIAKTHRYRLQLARALLRRPSLLLIDSDESHQDKSIQSLILNLFQFLDGTIVINTQLPKLQNRCNQIWRMDKTSVECLPVNGNADVVRIHNHG